MEAEDKEEMEAVEEQEAEASYIAVMTTRVWKLKLSVRQGTKTNFLHGLILFCDQACKHYG